MNEIAITGGSGFIGTNLVEHLLTRGGTRLLNLDLAAPRVAAHRAIWRRCDLLDAGEVRERLQAFRPAWVVHLGGRTDMAGKTIGAYAANHVGTENLIAAIRQTPSVERVIFTSSQFVVGPGPLPVSDLDFRPHTIYGQSKVLSEMAVRRADLAYAWTIIRPTNIWGRWHPRYPEEFWKVLKQGRYLHPGGEPVVRSYGYVGTVVEQIGAILGSAAELVDRQILYVGDPPMNLLDWANAFSRELRGRPVQVVPRPVLRAMAKVGDAVVSAGGRFPIFTSRYRSMTESYRTPMEKTFACLGRPTIPLEAGVRETVAWLRGVSPFWS